MPFFIPFVFLQTEQVYSTPSFLVALVLRFQFFIGGLEPHLPLFPNPTPCPLK